MKNLLVYYLVILLPVPLLVWVIDQDGHLFVWLLLAYVFYRMIVDSFRLKSLELIPAVNLWKAMIPLYYVKYFKQQYFQW